MSKLLRVLLLWTCLWGGPPAKAERVDSIVDDVLSREAVGSVHFDIDTNQLYVEMVRGLGTLNAPLPYTGESALYDAAKRILVVELEGDLTPRPLFEQDDQAGFFFVGADPRSPSGRFWAIAKLSRGKLVPGVFDNEEQRAYFFDIPLIYNTHSPSLAWVSDEELLLFVDADQHQNGVMIDRKIKGAKTLESRRTAAWYESEVSSSAIGSGNFAIEHPPKENFRFLLLNVRSGNKTVVGEGPFLPSFELSPDAAFLAVYARRSGTQSFGRVPNNRTPIRLSIIDLEAQSRFEIASSDEQQVTILSWSPAGRYLLVSTNEPCESGVCITYSVYDALSRRSVFQLPNDVANPVWAGSAIVYKSSSGGLVRKQFDGLEHNSTWREDKLASAFQDIELIAADTEGLFATSEGYLWNLRFDGSIKNLTSDLPHGLIQHYRGSRRYERHFGFNPWVLPSLSEILFSSSTNEPESFFVFNEKASSTTRYQPPEKQIEILHSDSDRLVYLHNNYLVGSEIKQIAGGESDEGCTSILRFNEHLVGYEPSVGPIRLDHIGLDDNDLISWLYLPHDADSSAPQEYPLVVIPYAQLVYDENEPRGTYSADLWNLQLTVNTSVEVFAAHGYAVLLPSIPLGPRDQPEDPLEKLLPPVLAALDAAKATGFVDVDRLAVSGQSGGGYTALAIGAQTNTFHAVIAMASTSNLTSHYGQFTGYAAVNAEWYSLDELTHARTDRYFRMGSAPWEDEVRYVRNSPLFFAEQFETPLMLIHGDLDIVKMSQAEEMYTALARQNKDVLFVRYWGEHHIVEQPQNQRDMWQKIFGFLEDNGVTPGPKTVH